MLKEHGLQKKRPSKPWENFSGENYSYVHLTAPHDYIYPIVDEEKSTLSRRDSPSPRKPTLELIQVQQPPLPLKGVLAKGYRAQVRCRHCHELYVEANNSRGSCEYAPDCVRSTINTVSCIGCAQCVCYHCAADAEGDYAQHPCDCSFEDNYSKRWMCLVFLSLLVPCLWLYPPLRLCHRCGVRCGLCGGRHSM